MKTNWTLLLKYILNFNSCFFFNSNSKYRNELLLTLPARYLYYISLHFKFSTLFYSTQLIEVFSFSSPNSNPGSLFNTKNSVLVYNFSNTVWQKRLTLFYPLSKDSAPVSISELFTNAGWLERETAELSGIFFSKKRDTRNLMLPYSDNSQPFNKNFPSIGTKEIFYDLQSDFLLQQPVTVQF
jgi:NADH:ubiquinone oxidoreductase subunit C